MPNVTTGSPLGDAMVATFAPDQYRDAQRREQERVTHAATAPGRRAQRHNDRNNDRLNDLRERQFEELQRQNEILTAKQDGAAAIQSGYRQVGNAVDDTLFALQDWQHTNNKREENNAAVSLGLPPPNLNTEMDPVLYQNDDHSSDNWSLLSDIREKNPGYSSPDDAVSDALKQAQNAQNGGIS